MKIRLTSDLHINFYKDGLREGFKFALPTLKEDKETTLVVAGDISESFDALDFIDILSKRFKNVVFCLGNHDYYDSSIKAMHEKAKKFAERKNNVYFLEKSSVEIDGVTFAGGTLWSDFALFNTPAISSDLCRYHMNDYQYIFKEKELRLMPQDTIDEFNSTIEFLKTLKGTDKLVVVTHHAPSSKSVKIDMVWNSVSPAYASNLDDFIKELKPKYWLHGHLHGYSRYYIGDCQVVQNCFGYYKHSENGMYNSNLILDI